MSHPKNDFVLCKVFSKWQMIIGEIVMSFEIKSAENNSNDNKIKWTKYFFLLSNLK